jgi:hypothetical protein
VSAPQEEQYRPETVEPQFQHGELIGAAMDHPQLGQNCPANEVEQLPQTTGG